MLGSKGVGRFESIRVGLNKGVDDKQNQSLEI